MPTRQNNAHAKGAETIHIGTMKGVVTNQADIYMITTETEMGVKQTTMPIIIGTVTVETDGILAGTICAQNPATGEVIDIIIR